MIHVLDRPADPGQLQEMLEAYSFLVKEVRGKVAAIVRAVLGAIG